MSSYGCPCQNSVSPCQIFWGRKKTNKQKTHKHFSDGPCGTIVPGTNPHPSQGQKGQSGDFTVEVNRKRPVCPRDGSQFVPGMGSRLSQKRGPVCPEHRPAQNVYVHCFFSCPNIGRMFWIPDVHLDNPLGHPQNIQPRSLLFRLLSFVPSMGVDFPALTPSLLFNAPSPRHTPPAEMIT